MLGSRETAWEGWNRRTTAFNTNWAVNIINIQSSLNFCWSCSLPNKPLKGKLHINPDILYIRPPGCTILRRPLRCSARSCTSYIFLCLLLRVILGSLLWRLWRRWVFSLESVNESSFSKGFWLTMGCPLSSQTLTGIFKPLDCFLPRPVLWFTFWVFLAGCFAGMLPRCDARRPFSSCCRESGCSGRKRGCQEDFKRTPWFCDVVSRNASVKDVVDPHPP
jgi:hypothetical protein